MSDIQLFEVPSLNIPKLEIPEDAFVVKELKGTAKPEIGDLFFGKDISGLKTVLRRYPRRSTSGKPKYWDSVEWYEQRFVKENAIFERLIYYMVSPPMYVCEDYYYPVAQWNITDAHLLDQDNVPLWQQRAVSLGDSPVFIAGESLKAFHFVYLHTRFQPERRPDGSNNDGHFIFAGAVSGKFINDQINARKALGGADFALRRRRVTEGLETSESVS